MSCWRQAAGCTSRELDSGEIVVLSPDGSQALVLNPTAAVIFELCAQGAMESMLVAELSGRFAPVPRQQLDADVHAIVGALAQAGLLVEAPCGDTASAR
jgi:hypothetical protein